MVLPVSRELQLKQIKWVHLPHLGLIIALDPLKVQESICTRK